MRSRRSATAVLAGLSLLAGLLAAAPLASATAEATPDATADATADATTDATADATGSTDDVSGPRLVTADGDVLAFDSVDPSSRTAGMLALYTPAFGASTRTNAFGAEAVLEPADGGGFEVTYVCTVFDSCERAGDNPIPADGYVVSASPGGTPDVRLVVRDQLAVGDVVDLEGLTLRSVSSTLDATDPTPATNPDGVDPGTGRCYPGCRGAEQLIVYTPAWGERTGTNDFGYEVDVVDSRVVARGGNNRVVPEDGFVLSGHGGRGSWLSSNAVLGALVEVDGTTVTVTVDAETYVLGAEQAVEAATAQIAAAEASCLDAPLPSAREAVTEATDLLTRARATEDPEAAVALAEQARTTAELASYRTTESRPVEGRGIWVRPTETTPEEIEATLDAVAEAGLNVVMLETVWQGWTIYPSDAAASYGIEAQRPEMVGFDPMQVWVDEAHERGIELHAWIHTFFVGIGDGQGGPGPVLSANPDWAAVEREDVGADGPMPSSQEPGYYFMDPAMPGPRAYVGDVLEEILTGYDVDGLHLDYIRYPVSTPWETAAYSYSDFTREAFAAEHGVDPYELTPADALWETWSLWREEQVTSFVAEVREMQQDVAPDTQLSAAVFPDPSDGLDKKFQNWGAWVDAGYVDFLTGMSFGTSGESVARETALMRDRVGERNLLYTATYGPFRGSTPDVVLEQVDAVRDARSDGAALFAWNQLSLGQATALQEGVFREPAAVPHADLLGGAATGVGDLRADLDRASGACVPAGVAGRVDAQLRVAERLLDGDDGPAALERLERAERLVAGADVQEDMQARLLRDLDMYARWVTRHLEISG